MNANFTDDHFKVETFMEYVREKSSKGELANNFTICQSDISLQGILVEYLAVVLFLDLTLASRFPQDT